jgi:signal transduction histidine kinase
MGCGMRRGPSWSGNGWRLMVVLWGLVWGVGDRVWGQESSRWRVFRQDDGLAEDFVLSVTVSPRGQAWVRHPAVASVNWLDGYQVREIPGLEENRFPVWESRSGQIWSPHKSGLAEFRREGWVVYPVDGIRDEHLTNSLRMLRPIPVLPAERDHVLVLLPQQLIKVNPASGRTVELRSVTATGLRSFTDLVESRDGGAWVVGAGGVARLPGPVRLLAADSVWHELLLDPAWGIEGLSRPVEDDEGKLVVVGERASGGERVILVGDGENWEAPKLAPEGTRAAWRGMGERFWAQARGSLYETVSGDRWQVVGVPGLPRAQLIDTAFEPGGVFWLATSEGLIRHAPQTWRRPAGARGETMEVLGMVEHRGVGVWMVSPSGLYLGRDGRWRLWDWPEGFKPSGSGPRLVQWLEGERVLVLGAAGGALIFELVNERFHTVEHPEGRSIVRGLGGARPGAIFLETVDAGGGRQVEVFDGSGFRRWPDEGKAEVEWERVEFVDGLAGDRIWLGSTRGLTVWDPVLGRFEKMEGAPEGTMHAVLAIAGGKVWFGGEGMIVEYDGRGFQVRRSGLGRVRSLRVARDGTIWVASESGLFSYADQAWMDYGPEESFPDVEVRDILPDREGTVYAATGEGLFRYHREADLDAPVSFFAGGTSRQTPTTREYRVSYGGQDRWHYTPERRLLFSHRLDDGVWSVFGESREVVLTNLTAGQHRLAVRAMDRNRNEELEPVVWEFVAFVPWYAEPRILLVTGGGLLVAGCLAWLAINRHLRLRRSHAEVEGIVEQRTRELQEANRELLHSQKMRALGTLAAGIAHDFNSILSIIKGSAQIIEHHLDDRERIRTRVSRIRTMVEQGSGIVQAMLGFSRGAALAAAPCDLSHLVGETVRLVADQVGARASLECEVGSQPVVVRTVAPLIRQMLLNLVFNAVEASVEGGVIRLRVTTAALAPPELVLAPAPAGAYARIDVIDAGHGIPPEVQSRVFEPFFTTKAFSTRRGTGLGLSMVYEIAKELGVGLRIESELGRGSAFSLLIPQVEGVPEAGAGRRS